MEDWGNFLKNLGSAIGEGLQDIGTHTARAAAQANTVSAQAQSAQGAFNQASANQANSITDNRIAAQYGFNSAMMANANQFNMAAWDRSASWNEEMWERQAEFNREEAEKNRQWQEMMSNTQYQRAMADMEKAGLNPILAYSQGGAGVPGGATASVGGASMGSASAVMASGGLQGAESASVGNYNGQMEYMGGMLGLLSTILGGISTATDAASKIPEGGNILDKIFSRKGFEDFGSYDNEHGEHIAGSAENKADGRTYKRYMAELTKYFDGDLKKAQYHYVHLTTKQKQKELKDFKDWEYNRSAPINWVIN